MPASRRLFDQMCSGQLGWRIEDLQTVAKDKGLEWRRPGRGGSHVIFSAPGVSKLVSVPARRPIKPIYVQQFLALIKGASKVTKQ